MKPHLSDKVRRCEELELTKSFYSNLAPSAPFACHLCGIHLSTTQPLCDQCAAYIQMGNAVDRFTRLIEEVRT